MFPSDGQLRSYAGAQVCNRTNEISLAPQKSSWGKRCVVDRQSSDLPEALDKSEGIVKA
jgi:hypothetical protein